MNQGALPPEARKQHDPGSSYLTKNTGHSSQALIRAAYDSGFSPFGHLLPSRTSRWWCKTGNITAGYGICMSVGWIAVVEGRGAEH